MSTMLEALSDGSLDLQNKRDLSTNFAKDLVKYRDTIVSDYLKYKIDLNKAISKIATKHNLNDDQIQRIVEEVNNQVYLTEYSRMKNKNEREVDFELASKMKVKELCGSKSEPESEKKDEPSEPTNDKKVEKTASANDTTGFASIFNGKNYSYGNLAPNMSKTHEEFLLEKMASFVDSKEDEMNKIATQLELKANEIGDALVKIAKYNGDANSVFKRIISSADLSECEAGIIKKASESRLQALLDSRQMNSEIEFGLEIEKEAECEFSLGKFSLDKTASDERTPMIVSMSNKSLSSYKDFEKLASEFKDTANQLKSKADELKSIKNKLAESGVNDEHFEKEAGAASNFFQMR